MATVGGVGVLQEMVKVAGLDPTMLHSSVKVVNDSTIATAGKLEQAPRRVHTYSPVDCHRPTCSFCYKKASFGSIVDWS